MSATASNRDTITDFVAASDTIRLDNAAFTALGAAGQISVAAFHIGAAAHDASDRIIYNQTTGVLTYDANGNAAGGAIQFAVLGTTAQLAAITVADFVVI